MEVDLLRGRPRTLVLMAVAFVVIALTLVAITVGGSGNLPGTAQAAVHKPGAHRGHRGTRHHGVTHRRGARHAASEQGSGAPDTDNVQSGDQSSPDGASAASAGEAPGTESESKSDADGPGGPNSQCGEPGAQCAQGEQG